MHMAEYSEEARQFLTDSINASAGVVKLAQDGKDYVIELLVTEALIAKGWDLERGQLLTERALADALNKKIFADYGIDVGDLLDRESVRRATRTEALRVIGERLGVQGSASDVARAMRSAVQAELRAAARAGDSEIFSAINLGQRAIDDAVRSAKVGDYKEVTNTTSEGEKNRNRQATYRANHKRIWVTK